MQSLVSLSYLPDTMLCLSFSFSVGVAAADLLLLLCTAFSCNCFGVCFLCCIFYFAPLHLSLSLSFSTHTHFFALCLFCAFFLLRILLLLFFDAHTSHWLLFFLSLWPFICPVVVVVAVCIFFAIFSHLLCSIASFVLLRWISTCQTSIKRVCVCRNATGEGEEQKDGREGGGDCYQIGCCTLLHFSSAAISNWLGIGLVSS